MIIRALSESVSLSTQVITFFHSTHSTYMYTVFTVSITVTIVIEIPEAYVLLLLCTMALVPNGQNIFVAKQQ